MTTTLTQILHGKPVAYIVAVALTFVLGGCAASRNAQNLGPADPAVAAAEPALTPNQLLEQSLARVAGSSPQAVSTDASNAALNNAVALAMADRAPPPPANGQPPLDNAALSDPRAARQEITSAAQSARNSETPRSDMTSEEIMSRLKLLAREANNARVPEPAAGETFEDRARMTFGALANR
jgi:hypothetical protein